MWVQKAETKYDIFYIKEFPRQLPSKQKITNLNNALFGKNLKREIEKEKQHDLLYYLL